MALVSATAAARSFHPQRAAVVAVENVLSSEQVGMQVKLALIHARKIGLRLARRRLLARPRGLTPAEWDPARPGDPLS
jgi:hypothetical protein